MDDVEVEMGRKEELEFMIKKLDMFQFGDVRGGRVERGQAADDDEVG